MQPVEMKQANFGKGSKGNLPLHRPTNNLVHAEIGHHKLYPDHRHFLYLLMDPQNTILAYHQGSQAAQHRGTPGRRPRTRFYEHNRYWKSSCPSSTSKQLQR